MKMNTCKCEWNECRRAKKKIVVVQSFSERSFTYAQSHVKHMPSQCLCVCECARASREGTLFKEYKLVHMVACWRACVRAAKRAQLECCEASEMVSHSGASGKYVANAIDSRFIHRVRCAAPPHHERKIQTQIAISLVRVCRFRAEDNASTQNHNLIRRYIE